MRPRDLGIRRVKRQRPGEERKLISRGTPGWAGEPRDEGSSVWAGRCPPAVINLSHTDLVPTVH